jgi:hypothetical protein
VEGARPAVRKEPAKLFGNIQIETSAKPVCRRSGVSAERRFSLENEGFGFLPKAATLLFE